MFGSHLDRLFSISLWCGAGGLFLIIKLPAFIVHLDNQIKKQED